jgi:hypothetical protein
MVILIEDALVAKLKADLDAAFEAGKVRVQSYPDDFRGYIDKYWNRSAVLVSYAGGGHKVRSEEGGLTTRELFFDLVVLSQNYRDNKGHHGAAEIVEAVISSLSNLVIPMPNQFPPQKRVTVLADAHLDMGEDKIHAYNIRILVK